MVAISASLALTGWQPLIGGLTVFVLTGLAASKDVDLGLVFLGVFAVALDWISRGWWVRTVIALLGANTAQFLSSGSPVANGLGVILGSTIAIAGGLTLRHFQQQETLLKQKRAAAEQERAAAKEKQAAAEQERAAAKEKQAAAEQERAAAKEKQAAAEQKRATAEEERIAAEEALELAVQAQKEIRQDLAATLHDTLAADLVRIALSSHSLATTIDNSEVAETARELENASRSTLQHLRAVIATTKVQHIKGPEPTIASVIKECSLMLSRRNIKISSKFPENLDARCSTDLKKNIALIIQESSMNILKYGKADSGASISIETSGEAAIDIMIANECTTEHIEDHGEISSGFGLENLSNRIINTGGFLEASRRGDRWVLVAHLVEQVKERV